MITEAALVVITVIGTEGFYSSVFFVFLKQEGGIMKDSLIKKAVEWMTDEDVINMFPFTLITVCSLGAMLAMKRGCDRKQS